MRQSRRWVPLGTLVLALAAGVAVFAATTLASSKSRLAGKPIVIGAAIDETTFMKNFDDPALAAAKLEVAKINAKGGVLGRPLQFKVINDMRDPAKTRQAALSLVGQGVDIGWVTCDVDWSTPSIQVFIAAGKLTIAPCIGTDQMGPKRFGQKGHLAFTYGNVAQDEGAAFAEYAIKRGWKTAVVVTDKSILFTIDECKAFTKRFTQRGGKVVSQESFVQGDKTIGSVVSRVNGEKVSALALCTITAPDLTTFVTGVRSANNNTPIIGPWSMDGAFWFPKNPKVSNFYVVTYASIYGDDPSAAVRSLIAKMKAEGQAPATGGFVTGAAAIDGIAAAIKKAGGSTDGKTLAKIMEHFSHLPTISGKVSFTPSLHAVFGRAYRVIKVTNNVPKVVAEVTASSPANIG